MADKNTRTIASQAGRIFSLSALTIALFHGNAHAQLTHNLTIGNAKALGLANSVTADPPGVDSIHFNPAGLAKISGRMQQLKLLGALVQYDTSFSEQQVPESVKQSYNEISGKTYPLDTEVAGKKSSTNKPALMLPFVGLKTMPVLGAPFAGIAVEEEDYGWTFATAIYSPQAIGYDRGKDDPGAFQGQKLSLMRLTYFSPSVAFHFNDTLMFGASIGLSWQGFGIESKFRAPESTIAFVKDTTDKLNNPNSSVPGINAIDPYDTVGTLEMELQDPLAFSFNLGVLWEPTEWLSVGAVYQSESSSELEGDFKMTYTDEWNGMISSMINNSFINGTLYLLNDAVRFNGNPVESGSVSMDLVNPAHFALGTSVKILPDLKVNFDVKWTDYSSWESLDFKFNKTLDFLNLANIIYKFPASLGDGDNADPKQMKIKRAYESAWHVSIGLEYQYNDRLVLRAGYEPRTSVIPDDRVDLLAPLAEAKLYTVGAGYQIDNESTLDLGFGYLDSGFKAGIGQSQNSNSIKSGRVVYNPYAFLALDSETTAYVFALTYDRQF